MAGCLELFTCDIHRRKHLRPQILEQRARLLAVAAADFDQRAIASEHVAHGTRMRAHDREFGARRIVLGKSAYFIEEPAAARIVEKLGRDLFLRLAESGPYFVQHALLWRQQVEKGDPPGCSHHESARNIRRGRVGTAAMRWRRGLKPRRYCGPPASLFVSEIPPAYCDQPTGLRSILLSSHFLMRLASPMRVCLPHE